MFVYLLFAYIKEIYIISIYNFRSQPTIPEKYFGNIQQRSRADVDSLMLSLSGAIQGVQVKYLLSSFIFPFFF
jgi:hypothetical protein